MTVAAMALVKAWAQQPHPIATPSPIPISILIRKVTIT